jgi:uncharacterized membrane protein YgcG
MRKWHFSCSLRMVVCLAAVWLLVLTKSALAADTTLGWDPNSEADLAGYGAYYFRLDDPAAVYNLFGYTALADLDDTSSPTVIVTGLETGVQYQFAVTAYDAVGNESSFSVPVCAEIGAVNVAIACPSSDGGGGSGGGSGGGGGGGCFIRSISGGPGVIVLPVIVLFLLWLFVSFWRIKNRAS